MRVRLQSTVVKLKSLEMTECAVRAPLRRIEHEKRLVPWASTDAADI